MNNEIKEILSYLKKKENTRRIKCITIEESKQLLDYITNLQQENERLKENAIHNDKVVDKAKWNEMIYKSRCEKASDKIQYIIDYGFDYDGFNTVESLKGLIDMLVDYARESKNILQGENNE